MMWQWIALLIMPVSALVIGQLLVYVADRDAKREDQRHPAE